MDGTHQLLKKGLMSSICGHNIFLMIFVLYCGVSGPPCLSDFEVVLPHMLRIMDYYVKFSVMNRLW